MKKVLSVAVLALMVAGATAFACDTCGCKDKKAENKSEAKTECTACTAPKKCENCTAEKKCDTCTKKAEAKKTEAKQAEKSE